MRVKRVSMGLLVVGESCVGEARGGLGTCELISCVHEVHDDKFPQGVPCWGGRIELILYLAYAVEYPRPVNTPEPKSMLWRALGGKSAGRLPQ